MLMKWEDLLPGDVLELNPEFCKFGKDEFYWIDRFKCELIIEYVDFIDNMDMENQIRISILNMGSITINKDNGSIWSYHNSPLVFTIKKLIEE